jgi:hypothetical protein
MEFGSLMPTQHSRNLFNNCTKSPSSELALLGEPEPVLFQLGPLCLNLP